MELAARIGTMAKNGIMKTTITIASDATNMLQVSTEITARLAEIGIENAVVSYAKNDYSSINNRFLEGIFVKGIRCANPIRYRNGVVNEAAWGASYDGIINIGDVYDIYPFEIPSFTRPWGGRWWGYKCLTPRRLYRRFFLSSARFCSHSHRWEVAA